MVTVRKMEPSEAVIVKKLAKKSFSWLERLFVGVPKEAMVAEISDRIVGGIFIKYVVSGGKKTAYIETAFVVPEYHGQGIGGVLYEKAAAYLWGQDSDALTAIVKDDNVGSWKLFLNNGFSRVSIAEIVRCLGLKAAVVQYFATPLFASNGMEFYLSMKDVQVKQKDSGSSKQICCYLLANALLVLAAIVENGSVFSQLLCAYMMFLVAGVVLGYAGTLFSKRRWSFRLNSGGALLIGLINLIGGFYPMIGNWYPTEYEASAQFRKRMGVTALCDWLGVIFITVSAFALQADNSFTKILASLGCVFLLYRMIPIYPFEAYGGGRILRWSRCVYAVLAITSAAVIVWGNYLI